MSENDTRSTKQIRYRHWTNTKKSGATVFATTTCLDFAHLFARPEIRTEMMKSLVDDCRHYNADLHAFVIMTHHLHLLVTPKEGETISNLMRKIKLNSSRLIRPKLNPYELSQLEKQSGLNESQFWMRSFRAFEIVDQKTFEQKANYVQQNPVRAELLDCAADYYWGSAYWYDQGFVQDHWSLDLELIVDKLRTSDF